MLTEFLLMSLLTAPGLTVDGATVEALPDEAGAWNIETTLDDGKKARFSLSRPAQIHPHTPLVLVLHYGGQPTRFYGRPLIDDLFGRAWQSLDAVYVAPESLGGRWEEAGNESFVMQLLAQLREHYGLGAQHTVVAGYSMGAMGSWHLVRNYPESFAAAVPVAGFPGDPLRSTVPVYTLATRSDEIFAFDRFEAAIHEAVAAGQTIEFQEVEARGHYDVGGFTTALNSALPWLRAQLGLTNDTEGETP